MIAITKANRNHGVSCSSTMLMEDAVNESEKVTDDELKAAYDENKAQLQTASGYGMEESYV